MNISVVIPAYNEEERIGKCLEALSKQTLKPFEIIVVDNNCTDKTAQIARSLGARVVTQKNQGISWSRDGGFNAARGDVIVRTDADSFPSTNWIERITHTMKEKDWDAFSGSIVYFDHPVLKRIPKFSCFYMFLHRVFLGHYPLNGPNLVIKKSVWEKVKNGVCHNDKEMHEDLDLSIHVSRVGKIGLDCELIVYNSGRRILTNPLSFFFGYPQKTIHTVRQKHG